MTRILLLVWIVITIAVTTGCDGSSTDTSVTRIDDSDAEMTAAIQTAKATFPFFEENWETIESDGYSVKIALPTSDGELEHIWFAPLSIRDDTIVGTCSNEPVMIPGLKMGDQRTLSRDDISDWMILVGNKCYGGYTIRVLAKRDPEAAPPLDFVDPPTK